MSKEDPLLQNTSPAYRTQAKALQRPFVIPLSKWNHLKRNIINQSTNQSIGLNRQVWWYTSSRPSLRDSAAPMCFNRIVDNFPNTYIFFLNIYFLNWLCFIRKADILPNSQHFFSQFLSPHLMCFYKLKNKVVDCKIFRLIKVIIERERMRDTENSNVSFILWLFNNTPFYKPVWFH